jgi:hypothetical protein
VPTFQAALTVEGSAHYVELPFDPKAEFGRIRAPVRVTVNGEVLRTTVARHHGRDHVGLSRAFRAAAGIGPDDTLTVAVDLDTEPRRVAPPDELADALADAPDALTAYRALSYTHQREYAQWVGGAKKPATRIRRAERAIEMLRLGVRQP